ncbi:rod shape-determining protein MreD [Kineothrix sp. MB12-C1]|uniref:rod shape-determining protein MreD n=1 Tax=Kineothrix sp. MB12-C1 TaxID=3070215 RepID=UPI0027D2ED17|nr:rod shape-determining protein MreD [Kineothrix sp. MB12-C1]WMC92762.1 rod shape-determining protein MreD [Kineothrix sp. MB12-C1]
MKRVVVVTFLIFICFLLQCTVFQALAFGGIVPNLLIVLTASFGFMRGERSGLLIGFLSGLFIDIFFGDVIGFYALLYMYIGYTNGKFNRIFYPEDIKLPIVLIIGSDLFYGLVCYLLLFLMRARFNIVHYFRHIILPEIVYTIVITIFLYPIILWINRKLENSEKRGAKKFV